MASPIITTPKKAKRLFNLTTLATYDSEVGFRWTTKQERMDDLDKMASEYSGFISL